MGAHVNVNEERGKGPVMKWKLKMKRRGDVKSEKIY